MKYRSFSWYFVALCFQVKSLIKNTLLVRFIKNGSYTTTSNQFTNYLIDHGEVIYSILISKYQEFQNTKKYVTIKKPYLSIDLVNAGLFYNYQKALTIFWSHEASVEDIIESLKYQKAVQCELTFENGVSHSITVTSYFSDKQIFVVSDPLGDLNTKYRLHYGKDIYVKKSQFVNFAKNGMFCLSIFFDPREENKLTSLIELFGNKKYYYLSPYDYSMYQYDQMSEKIAFGARVQNNTIKINNLPSSFNGKIVYGIITSMENNEENIKTNNVKTFKRKTRYHSQRDN